ncbi:uncharacterized [Tachysurus ichikawai]
MDGLTADHVSSTEMLNLLAVGRGRVCDCFWTSFLVFRATREPEISISMMDDGARLGGDERAERFELFE